MDTVPSVRRPQRYLVELTPLADSLDDTPALLARARLATEDLSRLGTPVRLLRSVFVPDDRSFLLLFEGSSAWAAEEVGRRAAAGARRVFAAVSLWPNEATGRDLG